ncbi:hypothetical protein CYLTODRAFT_457301 [Cylindrobasidium torrendii FP15055 ss-10]|uniref:Uncharacterized protein n=1 Tax=Cylindrobasidium torrendii FP15055 ss-10 TaxID=1314674 RepID=A0A0D7B139_9AGAR|nr:hypothetical protein CYLTODRAFT_457301 [Cylindrobasidium torrendii FP15055 ss-10]
MPANEEYKCKRLGCSTVSESSRQSRIHEDYHRANPFICPYKACQCLPSLKFNFLSLEQLYEHSERRSHDWTLVKSFNTEQIRVVQQMYEAFRAGKRGSSTAAGHPTPVIVAPSHNRGPHQDSRGRGMPITPTSPVYTSGASFLTYYKTRPQSTGQDPSWETQRLCLATPPPPPSIFMVRE